MTDEEAIENLKILKEDYWETDGYGYATAECQETLTALDMAIKALEQDTVPFDFELYQAGLMDMPKGMIEVLDKIKAEILAMMPPSGEWMYGEGHAEEQTVCEVLSDVVQIIDKYGKEQTDAGSN